MVLVEKTPRYRLHYTKVTFVILNGLLNCYRKISGDDLAFGFKLTKYSVGPGGGELGCLGRSY